MSTPKPILVIRMPDMLSQSNRHALVEQLIELKDRLSDYHLIPLFESGLSRVEFECYNSTDNVLSEDILSEINEKLNQSIFIIKSEK
jgi:hypothetical protein